MSLTEGKNILVYVETAGDTPVGPALEILAKAKELAGAKGEKVIAAVFAKEPDAAARTAIEAGADEAVIVKTVRGGSFSKSIEEGKAGKIIEETIEIAEETVFTKIANVVKEISEAVNLEDADVIVSGGRGMGSKENFALVQQLADVCGGVVGATRPAIEEEWIGRSHQVGQSGKIVAPKLYIACGVSGATQHVSGMIGSGYIIAINKDEDAPIFDIADVGIVGDAMKILPLMIEEIKKYKEA